MSNLLISTSSYDLTAQAIYTNCLPQKSRQFITNPYRRRCSALEITELLSQGVIGLIAGLEPLTRDVLEQAKNLRVISRCGVGLDNVDLDAAKSLGIAVYNTPEAPAVAVSELTLGFMLCLLRKLLDNAAVVRAKTWQPLMGNLLAEQSVGIIGYGRIGQKVVRLLEAFDANALIYDPFYKQTKDKRFVALDVLLKQSTIVSLHLPGSAENRHFINHEKLALMPRNSFVINTARGDLVDEKALYQALKTEQLAGAALDVFEMEPYVGPLADLSNVVLTSHIGSYAKESRVRMEGEAMRNLLHGLYQQGIFSDIPEDI